MIKKEDVEKEIDANGSESFVDHPDSGDMSLTQITGKTGIFKENFISER